MGVQPEGPFILISKMSGTFTYFKLSLMFLGKQLNAFCQLEMG